MTYIDIQLKNTIAQTLSVQEFTGPIQADDESILIKTLNFQLKLEKSRPCFCPKKKWIIRDTKKT